MRGVPAHWLMVALLGVAGAVVITGCGGSSAVMGDGGAGRFPSETLRDWVSYADHVAVYTVVAEHEIPPPQEEIDRGEGLVGRDVTLHIDRTLWSAAGAPPLPDEIHMTALGWVLQDGERHALVEDGAPRVAVGERYLAPLVRVEDDPDNPEWWPLGIPAQMPLGTDDTVGETNGWSNALAARLRGRSVNAIRDAVTAENPDPLAQKHAKLRPSKRIRAVLGERGDQAPPAPSENAP
jgi:hypothetical protein